MEEKEKGKCEEKNTRQMLWASTIRDSKEGPVAAWPCNFNSKQEFTGELVFSCCFLLLQAEISHLLTAIDTANRLKLLVQTSSAKFIVNRELIDATIGGQQWALLIAFLYNQVLLFHTMECHCSIQFSTVVAFQNSA
jgi:hypothetical protein